MAQSLYLSETVKQLTLTDVKKIFKTIKTSHPKAFAMFLEFTFLRTKNNDFWGNDTAEIKRQLLLLWDFIQKRKGLAIGLLAIPAQSPEELPLILISQQDARYIVDSLEIALNQFELTSFEILSIGGLPVKRNESGALLAVEKELSQKATCIPEDPVVIQLAATVDAAKLEKIKSYLQKILEETHITNQDQLLMRDKCHEVMIQLKNYKLLSSASAVDEAITFLNWLLDNHFYFLGYRSYRVSGSKQDPMLELISGSGLGLLKNESRAVKKRTLFSMPKEAQRLAQAKYILVITKTNTKSHVHRGSYTDYISVKRFDVKGKLIGEDRFLGLFSRSAYNASVLDIPYIRLLVQQMFAEFKTTPSHRLGRSVLNILENYPRDDLFQVTPADLSDTIACILSLRERPITKLIIREDAYGRFYSVMIFLPKEKISAALTEKFTKILLHVLSGNEVSIASYIGESFLGRLHFIVRRSVEKRQRPILDFSNIENQIVEAAKTWQEKLKDLLAQENATDMQKLFNRYSHAFSAAYQNTFTPEEVLDDIHHLENVLQVRSISVNLYRSAQQKDPSVINFKLFQLNEPTSLSQLIPLFENMGLEAIEENAYKCKIGHETVWISCYELRIYENKSPDLNRLAPLFYSLFFGLWQSRVENDALNALVLACELPWHLVEVLRAYCGYYKQIGVYSQAYLINVLKCNRALSKLLLELFSRRFELQPTNEKAIAIIKNDINELLGSVTNLEEDKIFRTFVSLIEATVRTNYYQLTSDGCRKNYLSFKLDSKKVPHLPLPWPLFEIFVYSSRVEGIHLRASKVARGGIRWSDRREDFRTEVLGLMKAQQVKNSVIVPGGSKGGFVLKNNTSKMDRTQLQQEAIACYQEYISGLLDLTDNLVDGAVVHPPRVKIYDENDPYLVVAADKGTATFSDYANEVALRYHFWLGDAFASGGSHGYDHKKMAITARGAWISVETHFKSLGINPAYQEFTVVGIGDMSGDVFGNGMLLSDKIRLVAAFNHQHIFIDPNPNAAQSFKERQRLFNLPRSGWADYNSKFISKGGGVFERQAKTIVLSPEIKTCLDLTIDEIEPNLLIQAILKARVELLFNGGIGTYVKATSERNQEVGDKSNDPVRINASELRCKVVGEGGNLGFTQLARVEFAENQGLIFTDFIDNSAGVDMSDHEVNIKILLGMAIAKKQLTAEKRNKLLKVMDQAVAKLVLADNYSQTQTLSYGLSQAKNNVGIYMRVLNKYDYAGVVDRVIEFLPSEKTLVDRQHEGRGLVAPEIAVVMAYVKMDIKRRLLQSSLPDEKYFECYIAKEFPEVLHKQFGKLMEQHQLRREIIVTQLTNQLLAETGILFVERLYEETMAKTPEILRAYCIIREVYQVDQLFDDIKSLGFSVEASVQHEMCKHLIYFLRRAARWIIRHQYDVRPVEEVIKELNAIRPFVPVTHTLLHDLALVKYQRLLDKYTQSNVPFELAQKIANTYSGYLLLDIYTIAKKQKQNLLNVANAYFCLGRSLGLDWLREVITNQKGGYEYWNGLAQASLRDKLDELQARITRFALQSKNFVKRPEQWFKQVANQYYEAWLRTLEQLQQAKQTDYTMYTVAINVLDNFVDHLG